MLAYILFRGQRLKVSMADKLDPAQYKSGVPLSLIGSKRNGELSLMQIIFLLIR